MKIHTYFILAIFAITNLTAAELPNYLKPEFEADKFVPWEVERYIKNSKGPKILYPYTTKDDYKAPKESKAPYLNQAGVTMLPITNDNWAQTETWMGVNPKNPKNIIATANDFSGIIGGGPNRQYRMVAHASFDGGLTWERTLTDNHNEDFVIPVGNRGATIFDPIVTFNEDGLALYIYGYAMTSGNIQDNGIFCSISEDGGRNWNQWDNVEEVPIVTYSANGLQDRYHTAVDRSGGQFDGRFYVAWRDFSNYNGIRIGWADKEDYYSQDWDDTGVYNSQSTQAPFPIVGNDGTLWLSFRRRAGDDRTDAPLYYSTDGGESFNFHSVAMNNWNIGLPSAELEEGSNRVVLDKKDNMRMSTNPQLAVDRSNGPYRGTLYCIMPGKEGGLDGPNKIYLGILRDATPNADPDSWQIVEVDNSPNGNDMFFPAITVDPVTGYLHVFYYSSQDDPENIKVDGYYAYSYDGGQTWSHKRLTDESMTVRAVNQDGIGNRYWGDYACITAYDNHIYPLFWVQESEFSFNSNELYTSMLRTYPDKPENISTEFGDGVTISWNGIFDGLGEPIESYEVKIYKGDAVAATLEQGINSWTDTEATIGQSINYGIQVISKDARGEGEVHRFTVNVGGKIETEAPKNFVAVGIEGGLLLRYESPSESVDGQQIEGLSRINLYNDGTLLGTVSNENILAGEKREDFIQLPNDVYYENLYITAVRERDGVEVESQASNSSIAFTGEPVSDLSESFEVDAETIPYYTNGPWDRTDEAASDGDFSLTDSPFEDYTVDADNFIIFKPIVVTADKPKIAMDVIANVRDGDVVEFQTSNDFGRTWETKLSTNSTFYDGWTEDVSTSEWVAFAFDHLEEGQDKDTVFLRIRLESIRINFGEGVFVDNIRPDNIQNVDIGEAFTDVSIYPNPAQDRFTTGFVLPKSDYVIPKIYDIQGNLILTGKQEFKKSGFNELKMELGNLSNGVYYLQLESSTGNIMEPFSISK